MYAFAVAMPEGAPVAGLIEVGKTDGLREKVLRIRHRFLPAESARLVFEANAGDESTGQIETGRRESVVRSIQLSDADRKDVPVVLDLASGELLGVPVEGAQEIIDYFAKLGKGDLAWDGVLITLRGAKVHEWTDGVWKLLEPKREEGGCAHDPWLQSRSDPLSLPAMDHCR